MVIMENYFTQENFNELCLNIDRLHINYLQMEECRKKILKRNELEDCIFQYLELELPMKKFVLRETEEILYRSTAHKKDFSGYKAANGWNALQMYASQLFAQPWRKEYHELKMYSGFYKHNIEANLLGAEQMFEAMGYRHVGNGILVMKDMQMPKLIQISRDCLVAYAECQILKFIWEQVSPEMNITWLNILNYRRLTSGNIEKCIKHLKYKPDIFAEPQLNYTYNTNDNRFPTSPTNQLIVPNNFSYFSSNHHGQMPISNTLRPTTVPCCVPHCINSCHQCQYPFYSNNMPMKQALPAPPPPTSIPYVPNGYYCSNTLPLVHPSSTIYPAHPPITNMSPSVSNHHQYQHHYDTVATASISSKVRRSRTDSNVVLSDVDKISQNGCEGLAKNGTGLMGSDEHQETGDNWDYVYKDLEKQGYSKDLGERGDLLHLAGTERRKSKEPKKCKVTNIDEAMNTLALKDGPLSFAEVLKKFDQPVETPNQSRDRKNSRTSSYDNVSPTETTAPKYSDTKSGQMNYLPKVKFDKNTNQKKTSTKTTSTISNNGEGAIEKFSGKNDATSWGCKMCTYLNPSTSSNICDMCGKSRNLGEEKSIEVGGAVCDKCTLVNSRNATECAACSNSLKNSPTYI